MAGVGLCRRIYDISATTLNRNSYLFTVPAPPWLGLCRSALGILKVSLPRLGLDLLIKAQSFVSSHISIICKRLINKLYPVAQSHIY